MSIGGSDCAGGVFVGDRLLTAVGGRRVIAATGVRPELLRRNSRERGASSTALCGRCAETAGDDLPVVTVQAGCWQVQHDAPVLYGHINGSLEPLTAPGRTRDFVYVIVHGRLVGAMLESLLVHPLQILARTGRRTLGSSASLVQQKLQQSVSSPQRILLGRLPSAHQIAQRYVCRVRHLHRRQISGPIAARQPLSIMPIRLDSIPRLHRHQCRGKHFALHREASQLPVLRVSGRARRAIRPQVREGSPLLQQLVHRINAVCDRTEVTHLSVRHSHCCANGLCMDIRPYKSYLLHRRPPFVYGSAPRSFPTHSVIGDAANREPDIPL